MAINNVKWLGSRVEQDADHRLVTDAQIATWNAKANASHTHTKSQITDFPASLKNPTSVKIQLNGGTTEGTNQFTYDGSTAKTINITAASVGAATSGHNHDSAYSKLGHTHTVANITDFPASLKNPNTVVIQLNGGTTEDTNMFTYDGSGAKKINITAASVGAATSGHNHDSAYSKLGHTHTKSEITDFPTIPTALKNPTAIAIKLNGGTTEGTNMFTYDGSTAKSLNITPSSIGAATSSHTHTKSQIRDFPSSLKNPNSISIQLNGGTATTYDGSAAKSINITPSGIGAATASHTHQSADIASLDASKLTGTIDIARLPAGALERLYPVDNAAARLKLTKSDVQNGDTVKENDTGLLYFVSDDTKLGTDNAASAFTAYTAGSATSVPWSGVTGKPSTFTPSSHTHTKSQITDFPASLKNPTSVKIQLNGGTTEGTNMFTYDGSTAKSLNITPSSIGAATSSHTHTKSQIRDFPSSLKNPNSISIQLNGGTATTYDGSAAKSINITAASVGAAAASHTHDDRYYTETEMNTKLAAKAENSTVASNANLNDIKTPGMYYGAGSNSISNKPNNIDAFGLIVTHNASGAYYAQICLDAQNSKSYIRYCSNGAWSTWSEMKFTDTDTWRGIQNNLTSDSTTDSLSAAQGKVLKRLVDGKAASSHNHDSVYYKSGDTRNANTVLAAPNGSAGAATFRALVAADIPSITKSKITDFPASLKNPNSISIQLNGGTATTYDGSAAKSINITAASVGAAAASHTHDDRYYTETEMNTKLAAKSDTTHTHTASAVGAVSSSPTLVTSWDAAANPGYYYAAKGATNAPETTLGYLGHVVRSTTTVVQTIYPEGASGNLKQYVRRGTRNASTGAVTWGDWLLMEYVVS